MVDMTTHPLQAVFFLPTKRSVHPKSLKAPAQMGEAASGLGLTYIQAGASTASLLAGPIRMQAVIKEPLSPTLCPTVNF